MMLLLCWTWRIWKLSNNDKKLLGEYGLLAWGGEMAKHTATNKSKPKIDTNIVRGNIKQKPPHPPQMKLPKNTYCSQGRAGICVCVVVGAGFVIIISWRSFSAGVSSPSISLSCSEASASGTALGSSATLKTTPNALTIQSKRHASWVLANHGASASSLEGLSFPKKPKPSLHPGMNDTHLLQVAKKPSEQGKLICVCMVW